MLPGRVAVAADDVLVAPRDGATHRAAGPLRELGREQDRVVEARLRAEAAAHELADDAHLVGRHPERGRDLVADPPDPLRRDVDVERVAAPLADALVRLERVVVERLRPVLGLDDRVRRREPRVVVAALVAAGLGDERSLPHRLVGVEQRLELLPLDVDQPHGRLGLRERLGRDGADRAPLEVRVGVHALHLARPDHAEHAGCGRRRGEVDPLHAAACERAAQERGVQRSRQLEVARVARDRREPSRSRRAARRGRPTTSPGPAGHWSSASSSTSVQTSS